MDRGVYLTKDGAAQYLKDAGLDGLAIYDCLVNCTLRLVKGVQKTPIEVYEALKVQVQAKRYADELPPLMKYTTRWQGVRHGLKKSRAYKQRAKRPRI